MTEEQDSLSDIALKINDRIKIMKDKMEKTMYRSETDRLWVRIETLQWVLAQILSLRQ